MTIVNQLTDLLASVTMDQWIGIVGIFAAFIAAWIFYWRSLSPTELSYSIKSTTLLGGLGPNVSIFYKGNPVKNLHKANYVFWNSGKEPISGKNIATKSPLQIFFPVTSEKDIYKGRRTGGSGITLLDISILHSSRPDNGVMVTRTETDEGVVSEFSFEYLDPSQGFNAEVLFQNEGSIKLPIASGKVIGMKRDLRKKPDYPEPRSILLDIFAFAGAITLTVAFVLIAGYGPAFYDKFHYDPQLTAQQLSEAQERVFLPLLEAAGVFVVAWVLLSGMASLFRSRRVVPRELDT
jgi:hypothetical protein